MTLIVEFADDMMPLDSQAYANLKDKLAAAAPEHKWVILAPGMTVRNPANSYTYEERIGDYAHKFTFATKKEMMDFLSTRIHYDGADKITEVLSAKD